MKVLAKGLHALLGPPLVERFEHHFGPAVGLDAVFAINNHIGDETLGSERSSDELVGRLTLKFDRALRARVRRFHGDLRAWLDEGEVAKVAMIAPMLVERDQSIKNFDKLLSQYILDVADVGEALHNGGIFELLSQVSEMVRRVDAAADVEVQRDTVMQFITAWNEAEAASKLMKAMSAITQEGGIRYRYAVRRDALARRPDMYTDEPDFINLQQTKSGIDEMVQAFVVDMRGLNDAVAQAYVLARGEGQRQQGLSEAVHAIEKNLVAWYRNYVRIFMQAQSLRMGSWMEDLEHHLIASLRDQVAMLAKTSLLDDSDSLRDAWDSLRRQLTDSTSDQGNLDHLMGLESSLRTMKTTWIQRCEDARQTPGIPAGVQAAFADAKHEINGLIALPMGVLSGLIFILQQSVVTDEYNSEAFVTGVRRVFQFTNVWANRRKHTQEKKNGKSVVEEMKTIFGTQGVKIECVEEPPKEYNRSALRMILIHQIQNAQRAVSNVVGGRVQVVFYEDRVVVEDNGPGFSEEALAALKLDGPASQATPLPRDVAQGTGQGLWSIRTQLIPELGPNASMKVESEVGKGSKITTYFNKQKI